MKKHLKFSVVTIMFTVIALNLMAQVKNGVSTKVSDTNVLANAPLT